MKPWLQWRNGTSALVLALTSVSPASADVRVSFIEGAPKDRFIIANTDGCDLDDVTLSLDLSTSVGRLIFDTTAGGAGVDVFQPFDAGDSGSRLAVQAPVIDGDSELSLTLSTLAANDSVGFTIDVDDTLSNSELGQIRVSGSEVAGGLIVLEIGSIGPLSARFDESAEALIAVSACQ